MYWQRSCGNGRRCLLLLFGYERTCYVFVALTPKIRKLCCVMLSTEKDTNENSSFPKCLQLFDKHLEQLEFHTCHYLSYNTNHLGSTLWTIFTQMTSRITFSSIHTQKITLAYSTTKCSSAEQYGTKTSNSFVLYISDTVVRYSTRWPI
jgi:hypothetical protein